MRAFQEAAVAALEDAWNPDQVHAVGDVPPKPVTPYAVVSVSSGLGTSYLLSAEHGGKSYRIAVQAIGKSAREIGGAVEMAEEAFLDQTLYVVGYDCTPATSQASSQIIRDPDGGALLSCTLTYTFTAYPTE